MTINREEKPLKKQLGKTNLVRRVFTENTSGQRTDDGCNRNAGAEAGTQSLHTVTGGTNRLRARYIGPSFESDTQLRHVGCDFDPKVGFASRTDVSSASQATRYVWRGLKGAVTQTSIGHEANLTLDGNGERYLGLETVGEFRLVLFNRLAAEVTGGYVEDVVDTGFTLPNGRDVAADTYTGGTYSASLSASKPAIHTAGSPTRMMMLFTACFAWSQRKSWGLDLMCVSRSD